MKLPVEEDAEDAVEKRGEAHCNLEREGDDELALADEPETIFVGVCSFKVGSKVVGGAPLEVSSRRPVYPSHRGGNVGSRRRMAVKHGVERGGDSDRGH